jgi:hypothetical protein
VAARDAAHAAQPANEANTHREDLQNSFKSVPPLPRKYAYMYLNISPISFLRNPDLWAARLPEFVIEDPPPPLPLEFRSSGSSSIQSSPTLKFSFNLFNWQHLVVLTCFPFS